MADTVELKAPVDASERALYYSQYDALIDAIALSLTPEFVGRVPESSPASKRDKQNLVGAVSRDLGYVQSAVEQKVLAAVREKVGLEWKG